MTWLILIALGLIPWVIAVNRVVNGQTPEARARKAARREFDDALRRMLAPRPEMGEVPRLSVVPSPAQSQVVLGSQPPAGIVPEPAAVAKPKQTIPAPAAPTPAPAKKPEDKMPETIRNIAPQAAGLPAGLSIIEGFIPGDDLLELTLDEEEVAEAEAAGVRLDVRVERASAGQGSLVTVGGTPLAFIRGNAQVTPRDVILRIGKVA